MSDIESSDDEDQTALRRRIGSQGLPEFHSVGIETLTNDRGETSSQLRIGSQVPRESEIAEVENPTTDHAEPSGQRRIGFQVPQEPEIAEVETRRPGRAFFRPMHKVLPLMLKGNTEHYIPVVVSMGPYHHGKPELSLAEGFKPKALDLFLMGGSDTLNLEFYYDIVLEMVGEIRNCYERRSVERYSEHELARMLLFDACFIIIYMESGIPEPVPEPGMYGPQTLKAHRGMTMGQHLGLATLANVLRDMFLLENQIPFRVVKRLVDLRFGEAEGEMLLNRFLNGCVFGEFEPNKNILVKNMKDPLHLLEAFRQLLVSDSVEPKKHRTCFNWKWLCCFKVEQEPHGSPPINAEIGFNGSTVGDLETGRNLQNNADLANRLGPTANANLATAVSSATSSIHNKFLCCSTVQETHGNSTLSIHNQLLCCTTVEVTHDNQATNTNQNTSVDPRTRADQPSSNPVTDIGPKMGVDRTTSRCSHILNFLSRIVHRGVTREGSKVVHTRNMRKYVHSFRSATALKAKGIYFKPSSSRSFKDVNFNSFFIYAQLKLPTWAVSIYTMVFFLNMIAYEMSPNNVNNFLVTSYINLMKSLIESTEDVKELREQKILYNLLGSDEEVRDVYKNIKTYADPPAFHHLKEKIQAHYNSYMKTWIAELIHTHFRTPWTVLGLLAAMAVLAIASTNLVYSIRNKSKN